MKPTWKKYDIEEWEHGVAGCTPRSFPMPTDRFLWNDCGVCTNPHFLGVATKGWRIGIFTARMDCGQWVVGADVSFPTAGYCRAASLTPLDCFQSEWGAQSMELRHAALWLQRCMNPETASCPIPGSCAREALRLISEKIAELEPKKVPTFTQLSLFD